jgi:hypothetical protein
MSPELRQMVIDRDEIGLEHAYFVLSPKYDVRFLVFSHRSDTLGLAAMSTADWRELEDANAAVVAENFIDPRKLPNLMTELTDEKLPAHARARFERLLHRNKTV